MYGKIYCMKNKMLVFGKIIFALGIGAFVWTIYIFYHPDPMFGQFGIMLTIPIGVLMTGVGTIIILLVKTKTGGFWNRLIRLGMWLILAVALVKLFVIGKSWISM